MHTTANDCQLRRSKSKIFNEQSTIVGCPARARTWTLLIQSQTCCQLHHGAILVPDFGLQISDGATIRNRLHRNETYRK